LTSLVYSVWIIYYVVTMPWNAVRPIFAVMFFVPTLILLAALTGRLDPWIKDKEWFGRPAVVQLRWGIYMWFVTAWMLVAIAVLVGGSALPIHAVPYMALSLICVGNTLRLAFYDR
jgi:hypothetical protein